MGQYYKIINVDKKECITPWSYGSGAKLMEWSYIVSDGTANAFVSAMIRLLSDRWKGDRVYVVGDYADPESATGDIDLIRSIGSMLAGAGINPIQTSIPSDVLNDDAVAKTVAVNEDWQSVLMSLYKEFDWLGTKDEDGYDYSLYCCLENGFSELSPNDLGEGFSNVNDDWGNPDNDKTGVIASRYVCNSLTREYIDLRELPREWNYGGEDDNTGLFVSVFPLSLLLAMGNGLGGGDYYGQNRDHVGYWVPYASGVFFSDEIPAGFSNFTPDFSERTPEIEEAS